MTTACHCCGRTDVKKRPRAGKLHYPHKCSHGEWCVTGMPGIGIHQNHPLCDQCKADRQKERKISN